MPHDPRNVIWSETSQLLYQARYTEELEKALLARWSWLDSITRIVVAVASSGAALTGLVFWKNANYTFLWPLFTSASAALAIISNQLSVADKLGTHARSATELSAMTIDIGSLIIRMKINADFSTAEFEKKLLALRDKYRAELRKLKHDLLLTERLRIRIQDRLDATISATAHDVASKGNNHE